MKKIFYFFFVSIFFIFYSSETDDPVSVDGEPLVTEGKQVFRIDLKEITAKTVLGNSQKNLEPAFVLLV